MMMQNKFSSNRRSSHLCRQQNRNSRLYRHLGHSIRLYHLSYMSPPDLFSLTVIIIHK
jgi:hypothetical protein